MATRKAVNPLVKALQIPEGFTTRKVKGVLRVVAIVKKEDTMEDFSYEDYEESVMAYIADAAMSEKSRCAGLADLEKMYPEHAARARSEADARRGCTREQYQAELKAIRDEKAKKRTILIMDEPCKVGEVIESYNGYLYRVVEASSYLSEQDADELEDIVPGISSGWHTKVEFVS